MENEHHAVVAGCYIAPRTSRRVPFRNQPRRSTQVSIRSLYAPPFSAHKGIRSLHRSHKDTRAGKSSRVYKQRLSPLPLTISLLPAPVV
ncbi:MAG TPA: hypothetical protein VL442_05035 [Mucilaginibacter sp.]|nr:hypothetical protein [Mucilaginibacter sp.]